FSPSITRLPHSPTLFPYTTLFRSNHRLIRWSGSEDQLVGVDGEGRWLRRRFMSPVFRPRHPSFHIASLQFSEGSEREPLRLHKVDRKSTRLNSSHQIISYAVFCLK